MSTDLSERPGCLVDYNGDNDHRIKIEGFPALYFFDIATLPVKSMLLFYLGGEASNIWKVVCQYAPEELHYFRRPPLVDANPVLPDGDDDYDSPIVEVFADEEPSGRDDDAGADGDYDYSDYDNDDGDEEDREDEDGDSDSADDRDDDEAAASGDDWKPQRRSLSRSASSAAASPIDRTAAAAAPQRQSARSTANVPSSKYANYWLIDSE